MQKILRAANTLPWASIAHFLCVGGVIRENSSTQALPTFLLPPQNEKSHWSPHLCQATCWSSAYTNDLWSVHGRGCQDLCGSQMCLQQQKQFRFHGLICWFWLMWRYLRCGYEGMLSKAQHRKLVKKKS